ncbi:hypothetical protein D9M68_713660 [compost metagenome]
MVRVLHIFAGHEFFELAFDFQHVLAGGDAGAVGHAEDVRVHGHRGLAERGVEHHVGGLAAHAGQGFQRLAGLRHFAAVLLQQNLAGGDGVLRLRAEESDGFDVVRQARFAQRQQALRRAMLREELARGDVDRFIGGLRRQQHRDQQLERRVVFEFGGGMGIGRLQAGEDLLAFGGVHGC